MHQRKTRSNQIESLKQQLSTLVDVLAKDTEAVTAAARNETRVAAMKQQMVLALSADLHEEVARLLRLRRALGQASGG